MGGLARSPIQCYGRSVSGAGVMKATDLIGAVDAGAHRTREDTSDQRRQGRTDCTAKGSSSSDRWSAFFTSSTGTPRIPEQASQSKPIRIHTTKQLRASGESSDNARNSGGTVDGSSSRHSFWCTAERTVSTRRDSVEESGPDLSIALSIALSALATPPVRRRATGNALSSMSASCSTGLGLINGFPTRVRIVT